MQLHRAQRFGVETFSILGIPLAVLQIPQLIAAAENWIGEGGPPRCLTFANVHVVMEGQRNSEFRRLLTDPDVLNLPDGKPLGWLGQRAGLPLRRRVSGPEFMLEFFRRTAGRAYRHYFYGGAPGVAEALAQRLTERFPGTLVVGLESPPFRPLRPEEDRQAMDRINRTHPDIVWVGLGCPKQEQWAFQHRDRVQAPLLAAVGQAFDIHAGRVRQAPEWMGEHGLEWLYRLACNPRRLWRRYLIYNSLFLGTLLAQKLQRQRSD